jgi:hypothetical protein
MTPSFHIKSRVFLFAGEKIPADAGKIKHLGCPDTRQFEVFEMGGAIMLRESGKPDSHVAMIEIGTTLNKMAVAVLKANDGNPAVGSLVYAFMSEFEKEARRRALAEYLL